MEQWYIRKSKLFKTASPKQILDFDDYFDTVVMVKKSSWNNDKTSYFYVVTRKIDVPNIRKGQEIKVVVDNGNGNRYSHNSIYRIVDTNATGNQKLPIYHFV